LLVAFYGKTHTVLRLKAVFLNKQIHAYQTHIGLLISFSEMIYCKMQSVGVEAISSQPQEFLIRIRGEYEKWSNLVRGSNLILD
jgi:hypothetical protein